VQLKTSKITQATIQTTENRLATDADHQKKLQKEQKRKCLEQSDNGIKN